MKWKKILIFCASIFCIACAVLTICNFLFRKHMRDSFPKEEIYRLIDEGNWTYLQDNYQVLSSIGYSIVEETEADICFGIEENEGNLGDPHPFISISKYEPIYTSVDCSIKYKSWLLPVIDYYYFSTQQGRVGIVMSTTTPEAIIEELQRIVEVSRTEIVELPC